MKNTTRRSLLRKLGAGATAMAAVAVAGTSATAKAAELKPLDPNRTVVIPAPQEQIQVAVSIGPDGFELTSEPTDVPQIGVSDDAKTLFLGIFVDNENMAITGLDTVLNRAAAASGRCNITVNSSVETRRF